MVDGHLLVLCDNHIEVYAVPAMNLVQVRLGAHWRVARAACQGDRAAHAWNARTLPWLVAARDDADGSGAGGPFSAHVRPCGLCHDPRERYCDVLRSRAALANLLATALLCPSYVIRFSFCKAVQFGNRTFKRRALTRGHTR